MSLWGTNTLKYQQISSGKTTKHTPYPSGPQQIKKKHPIFKITKGRQSEES